MQQIIYAAATSVGVAACFGAPIGGLMFSIEITSSNYPTRAYWYGSLSSFFAAFTFRILWNLYAGVPVSNLLKPLIYDETFPPYPGTWADLIGVAWVGLACGIGGIVFVFSSAKVVLFRRYCTKKWEHHIKGQHQTLIYMVAVIFLNAIFTFPGIARYLAKPTMVSLSELISDQDMDYYWFSGFSIFGGLLLFLSSRFLLQILGMSFPNPLGVFSPTMVLGALFGRLIGEAMNLMFPGEVVAPGSYALMGAAAFPGAITQAVSTSVLLIELTGLSQSFLLVFAATVISYYISRTFYVSIYDSLMILQNLCFLPDLGHGRCQLRAKDIMGRDPVALHKWASLEDVLTVLRKHKKTYQKESDNYEIPIVKMKKMDSHQKQKKLIDDTPVVPLDPPQPVFMREFVSAGSLLSGGEEPQTTEVPFFAGSVLYRVLEREAIEWEKRVQDVSISSGLKFKDLSRVQVNMFNFLYPEVRFTNVVFNPLSSISIIHDGFILWRLSNAFVVSHGILKGMIIRRWLAKALTYSPSTSRKLMSLKVKHK